MFWGNDSEKIFKNLNRNFEIFVTALLGKILTKGGKSTVAANNIPLKFEGQKLYVTIGNKH